MNPDFLLCSPLARSLYHDCAKDLPIIDYHNHLPVEALTSDEEGLNVTQLWVRPDPYKHRAMRILGVEERFITGESTDYEKFYAWYTSLPRLIGNPLFDWSCMELSQVFGYELLPFGDPEKAWEELNRVAMNMTAQDILNKFRIEYSAPCASLVCDLTAFMPDAGVSPSLRGDDLLLPASGCIRNLETLTGISIRTMADYLTAVRIRLDAFRDAGCRFADHALDNGFAYLQDDGKNEERFAALLAGKDLPLKDKVYLSSGVLAALAAE